MAVPIASAVSGRAPQFAFLDRPATTLGVERVSHLLRILSEDAITYLTIGEADGLHDRHDVVLEVAGDASWRWEPTARGLG